MKFGIRECCDVVFRAKAKQKVGNKWFFKDEPVIYFDTLKTSSLEGAANTVYATGGRGNPQLMAWEGERTLKFTMEDALISPEGLSILTGADLIGTDTNNPIYVHSTYVASASDVTAEYTKETGALKITSLKIPADEQKTSFKTIFTNASKNIGCYVMAQDSNGNIISEPLSTLTAENGEGALTIDAETKQVISTKTGKDATIGTNLEIASYLVDFYEKKTGTNNFTVDITPDKFGGYYYIEASTLFRDQATGVDMPAEFIIPNGKIQSNFTFTMAGSGDPSTFTFTVDAFPGRVKGSVKDVLASIQIIQEIDSGNSDEPRDNTNSKKN